MKISYILSFVLTLIAFGLPIYGLVKKVRMKLPIVALSGLSTALAVMAVLASADMTAEKLNKVEEVQKLYPFWENFYRASTLLLILAVALNIYFLAREVRD